MQEITDFKRKLDDTVMPEIYKKMFQMILKILERLDLTKENHIPVNQWVIRGEDSNKAL